MGRPEYILVSSEKPHDAVMCNTGARFVMLSHHSPFTFQFLFSLIFSFRRMQ